MLTYDHHTPQGAKLGASEELVRELRMQLERHEMRAEVNLQATSAFWVERVRDLQAQLKPKPEAKKTKQTKQTKQQK